MRLTGLNRNQYDTLLPAAPPAPFTAGYGNTRHQPLWRESDLQAWVDLAERMKATLTHQRQRPENYSDHQAVNVVAGMVVTWRLWYRPGAGYDMLTWWFSTPRGWYVSNDARTWMSTDEMVRPTAYRYVPVASPSGMAITARATAMQLRKRIENALAENQPVR